MFCAVEWLSDRSVLIARPQFIPRNVNANKSSVSDGSTQNPLHLENGGGDHQSQRFTNSSIRHSFSTGNLAGAQGMAHLADHTWLNESFEQHCYESVVATLSYLLKGEKSHLRDFCLHTIAAFKQNALLDVEVQVGISLVIAFLLRCVRI